MTPLPALFEKVRKACPECRGTLRVTVGMKREGEPREMRDCPWLGHAALDELASRQHDVDGKLAEAHCPTGNCYKDCATLRRECRGEK